MLQNYNDRILAEQVRQLFVALKFSVVGSVLVATIVAATLWQSTNTEYLLLWYLLVLSISALRLISLKAYLNKKPDVIEVKKWEKIFATGLIASVFSWCLCSLFILTEVTNIEQLILSLSVAGICAGAVSSLSAKLKMLIIFVVPVLSCYAISFYLLGEEYSAIAMLSAVFMMVLISGGKRMYENTYQNIYLSLLSQQQALELSKSEQRFRDVSEAAGEYIWETDKNFNYTFVSDKSIDVKGLKPEEIVGQSIMSFTHNDEKKHITDVLARAAENHDSFSIEYQSLSNNGKECWEQMNGVPLFDTDDILVGFRGAGLSITERKMAEIELLNSKKKSEEASRAKSNFLATMSHEIRTPMNGVIGMAQMLSNSKLDESQKSYVEVITQSGQLLLGIINDILDYSKIESGKLELEANPFDINNLIDDVYKLMLNQALDKSITLKLINEESCSVIVLGDAVRLRQIMVNLLSNAIKFSDEGEVRLIVKCEQKNNLCKIKISVEDDGIGISDENKGRLFMSFMQADNSITRRFGGTGLGLAITEKLVSMMGGKIDVESRLGSGSKFIVELELESQVNKVASIENNAKTEEIDLKELDLSNKNLLLVEDNKVNQLVAKSILDKTGIKIEIVENGKAAVEKVANMNFDIILMDLRMPEMGGIEATKLIREMHSGKQVPIIALTANVASSDRRECVKAGMNDFMSKPFEMQELLNIVRKWLM